MAGGQVANLTSAVALRGNGRGLRHGSYATLSLQPHARDLADAIWELLPVAHPSDGPTVEALGMVLAQVERAAAVLGTAQTVELEAIRSGRPLTRLEQQSLARLSADARGWLNTAQRYFDALGMTPTSRARLGLDVARTEDVLRSYLHDRYGDAS